MAIERHVIKVSTTGSDASATGSLVVALPYCELLAGYFNFHASAPASTDTTLSSPGDPVSVTLLTITNSATDAWVYPSIQLDDNTASAITGAYIPALIHGNLLVELAGCDALTDALTNRQADEQVAVLFVDIDKFRSINDAYGYAVGDYVLHETAQRIKDFLAHSDASLYRIDGNKYAVLISDASTANELPAYGLQLLDAIHAPLAYRGHTIRLDAHIGLTTYRPDQEASMESILDQADFALAASKKEKNTPIYSYSIENYQAAFGSKALARDLAAAIQNDKIIPYYQPIIDISSGKIVAVEALARWQKSDTEIVSPKSFLKIIKNHNLLKYMTESILRQVHHDYQQTQARGIPPIRMGVTFTKYLLIEPDLVSYLFEKIQGKSLDWLQIEISEDITIDQSRDIINHNLHLMQDLGAAITLDDYGTGHASLTHLLEFPCDTLKLDRSFALRALKDQRVKHVIDGIVRIADDLGVRVLISGVETQEQYDFFTQWPNVLMQGYHVASPMPWDECLGLCKQQGDIS